MKRTLLVLCLMFLVNSDIYSQVTDVLTNLSQPQGLVVNGSKLYIAEAGTNKVIELELNTGNTIDFVTSLIAPIGLIQRGNDLLIAENDGAKVSIKDLTLPPSTATDYVNFNTGIEPWGVELTPDQNTLYISVVSGEVYKVDLTQTNLMPELIWEYENGDGTAIDLALNGNDLYISQSESESGGKILKIDVTESNPVAEEIVSNLFFPVGIEIIGSTLFFIDWTNQATGIDTLNKIDLNESNPQVTTILNNLNFPTYLTYSIATDELYISQSDRVSKIPGSLLGIDDQNLNSKFRIYPNPSTNYINISNLNFNGDFEIYDVLGNILFTGEITEKIDVTNLSSGIYFIKIEQTTKKFIKN